MKYIYSLLLVLFAQVLMGQSYFPSRNHWERKVPSDVGLSEQIIDSLVSFALSNEYEGEKDIRQSILKAFEREPYHKIVGPTKERGGPAGLILKDGYIVAEWGDIERVDMTFSVTKSYLSTMAGLAVQDSLIDNVADTVADYVWDETFSGEHNAKITWDHLLTQSSDWSGSLFGMYDWADRPPREGGIDSWKYRDLHEPGTVFEYNDVRVNVLAYSLLQVWRKPLPQVLKAKIMDPIKASNTWRWYGYDHSYSLIDGVQMQSVSGGGHSGGGVFISALDHARFGLLFLNEGKWKEKQIVDPTWIKKATTPSVANKSYGYMWWLNQGARAWEGVNNDSIFYAAGFGGNYIIIDPTNNLVVVFRWLNPSELDDAMRILYASH